MTTLDDQINNHIINSRALFTKLVTTPLLPTSFQTTNYDAAAERDGGGSPTTLAYLASSVANTAARVARLETHQHSLENKSFNLAQQNLATRHVVFGPDHFRDQRESRNALEKELLDKVLKPINSSLDQHDRVLADVIAIVNQISLKMDNQQQQQQYSSPSNNRRPHQQQENAANIVDAADDTLLNIVSPMTRVSNQHQQQHQFQNTHNNNNDRSSTSEDTAAPLDESNQNNRSLGQQTSTTTSTTDFTTSTSSNALHMFVNSNNNNHNSRGGGSQHHYQNYHSTNYYSQQAAPPPPPAHLIPSAAVSQAGSHHHHADASPYSRAYRALVATLEMGK